MPNGKLLHQEGLRRSCCLTHWMASLLVRPPSKRPSDTSRTNFVSSVLGKNSLRAQGTPQDTCSSRGWSRPTLGRLIGHLLGTHLRKSVSPPWPNGLLRPARLVCGDCLHQYIYIYIRKMKDSSGYNLQAFISVGEDMGYKYEWNLQ